MAFLPRLANGFYHVLSINHILSIAFLGVVLEIQIYPLQRSNLSQVLSIEELHLRNYSPLQCFASGIAISTYFILL